MAAPRTKIIPGNGPSVDRAAVIAQRDLVLAMRDKVRLLVANGMTVYEVLAARLTADTKATVPQEARTAEQFVRWLYEEV